ncbi:N-terminal EF-hand calcium-binding protein 1 isoform X1 [Aplysia californica]|uniref:N-terminal EF-hand calcium-binding protein 1 isoform X1 n=1 Tax=Aplysia californica TaxID=6500 RepID=A0ABM1VYC6_APLCA|nr:N-terminal EF-hand calcium-binding protein 1 isoform X1 [Aplysia californica]
MAEQQTANPTEVEKGISIFLDVFRRADKNDDGFISWEEFVSYCADGVMGKEELQALFDDIDSHNTNNIDTEELCTYFAQHLGEFREVFSLLEDLNKKTTNVLYTTSKVYKESNRIDKFITRFIMREIIYQMSALQRPMEAASDILDTQAREERDDIKPLEVEDVIKKPSASGIVPGRVVRRAKRQVSAPGSLGEVVEWIEVNSGTGVMNSQVDRLSKLIDRLERKVNFDGFRDEEVIHGEDDTLLLVNREFTVTQDKLDEFQANLRAYVDVTQGFRGCLNVSVRDLRDSNTFSLYEIWTSEEKQAQNCDNEAFKTLMDQASEQSKNSMKIPGSWWKREI